MKDKKARKRINGLTTRVKTLEEWVASLDRILEKQLERERLENRRSFPPKAESSQ